MRLRSINKENTFSFLITLVQFLLVYVKVNIAIVLHGLVPYYSYCLSALVRGNITSACTDFEVVSTSSRSLSTSASTRSLSYPQGPYPYPRLQSPCIIRKVLINIRIYKVLVLSARSLPTSTSTRSLSYPQGPYPHPHLQGPCLIRKVLIHIRKVVSLNVTTTAVLSQWNSFNANSFQKFLHCVFYKMGGTR